MAELSVFRQTRWGEWGDVFERIANAVRQSNFRLRAPMIAGVSPGELLEKIARLEIKRRRTPYPRELEKIGVELGALVALRARWIKPCGELELLAKKLSVAHEFRVDLENSIRGLKEKQEFGEEFLDLARLAYEQNDECTALRHKIDDLVGWRQCE